MSTALIFADLEEANDQEMVSLAAKDLRKCREDVVILEEQVSVAILQSKIENFVTMAVYPR